METYTSPYVKLSNFTLKISFCINYTKESNFGSYLSDFNSGQQTYGLLSKPHHRPNAIPYENQSMDSDIAWMWSGGVG